MVQMTRNVEARRHQIPTLSDLRDSGQIEADADLIMFIDRPEQRGEEFLESGGSAKERAAINVAKNRNGQTGGTIIKYLKEHTLFCDLDYVKKEHRDDIPF